MRIAVVANTSWYLSNFRLNLIHALNASGHHVIALGPQDSYVANIVDADVQHRVIPFTGDGTNPLYELATIGALRRAFRHERIDLALSYTPKGNIYTGLAARTLGIPTIPNISGLGRVFIRKSLLTYLVRLLYRAAFGSAVHVFFQNGDDLQSFASLGLADARLAERIPGSGVDLKRFQYDAQTSVDPGSEVLFLVVARMLWDKGIGEFVAAARELRRHHANVRFALLGFIDVANPAAIPRTQIESSVEEGVVEYLGSTDDVRPWLSQATCVVLPSYREGVPRSLLEAAAMVRPIIATDAPGCRDAVEDGISGFLCAPKNAADLAEKMLRVIDMTPTQRAAMGQRGRRRWNASSTNGLSLPVIWKF